jgi:hypothetical protein
MDKLARRRQYGKKPLIEVTELITSYRVWIAPEGCKSVDVWLVGAGEDGGRSVSTGVSSRGGVGGAGGEIRSLLNYAVTENNTYVIMVATSTAIDSTFNNVNGTFVLKNPESAPASRGRHATAGIDGRYPFDDPLLYTIMGSSGGGGGAVFDGRDFFNAAIGGAGAGNGGHTTNNANGTSNRVGGNAQSGRYGNGGGGGVTITGGAVVAYDGGRGSRGCVVLRYKKYE